MDDGVRRPFPRVLFTTYLMAGLVCAVLVVMIRLHEPVLSHETQLGVDVLSGTGVAAAGVPLLHECLHALVYGVAGCRPYFGRKGVGLFVGARKLVSRELLLVQLQLVPCAAVVLAVSSVLVLVLWTGSAGGWDLLLVGGVAAFGMWVSGLRDLHHCVFEVEADARWFWDEGFRYVPAEGPFQVRKGGSSVVEARAWVVWLSLAVAWVLVSRRPGSGQDPEPRVR